MPAISVIVPAYNAERTILETVQSIQQQSFQDLEIIVINDGSQDGTLNILKGIQDERLKIISYENGGLPTARNRGIANAQGEFISFIDADDLWTKDKLESQLTALQQNLSAGVAYSWTITMFNKNGEDLFFKAPPYSYEGDVYAQLLIRNFIGSGSNILIRKQVVEDVGGFEQTLKSSEDWDFYLRVAAKHSFALVPKFQILYRKNSGSMSSKVEVMEQEALRVIDRAYQAAPVVLQALKKETLAYHYYYSADRQISYDSNKNALSKAQAKLSLALKSKPKLLFDTYTQKLLIKLTLKKIFPERIVSYFFPRISKLSSVPDPRLNL